MPNARVSSVHAPLLRIPVPKLTAVVPLCLAVRWSVRLYSVIDSVEFSRYPEGLGTFEGIKGVSQFVLPLGEWKCDAHYAF